MKNQLEIPAPGGRKSWLHSDLERTLQKVDVGITPYLEIVDLRNAFVRIRSIDHPDEFVDIYRSSFASLVNALMKSEAELNRLDLRSGLFNSPSAL